MDIYSDIFIFYNDNVYFRMNNWEIVMVKRNVRVKENLISDNIEVL